ncbi:hypothetical protein, partial [Corallococcus terminator]
MGFTAGVLSLVLVAATGVPSDPSAEALCVLSGLYTTQRSYHSEKDRYTFQPATAGYIPLPCIDGSRPPAPESNAIGGCRYLFTVLEAGTDVNALRLEARGVKPDTKDRVFLLDARNGFVTRPGSNDRVDPADCETWSREMDPLQRYHALVGRHDCMEGPYAPEHPCTEALTELANLARAGVGVARMEYEAHPTARELFPLAPPTPRERLCGLAAPPGERVEVAATLARQGRLLDAVLAPGCRDEGLRASLPLLLRDGACPGNPCLELMTQARRLGVTERLAVLEARAAPLAQWLWKQSDAAQRAFLQAAELPGPKQDALLRLRQGQWP